MVQKKSILEWQRDTHASPHQIPKLLLRRSHDRGGSLHGQENGENPLQGIRDMLPDHPA